MYNAPNIQPIPAIPLRYVINDSAMVQDRGVREFPKYCKFFAFQHQHNVVITVSSNTKAVWDSSMMDVTSINQLPHARGVGK